MSQQLMRCGACTRPLPPESWSGERSSVCPVCGATTHVTPFAALGRSQAGAAPEPIESEAEASCFYHPRNRAAVPCEECGRFMCNLCELRADGRNICPVCFSAGLRGKKLMEFEARRTNYDTIALALTAPAILVWPAFITAPAALFVTFRHWKSPRGILRRSRFRYYLAALLALAEIGGLVVLIALVVRQIPFFR